MKSHLGPECAEWLVWIAEGTGARTALCDFFEAD
jgi:hypothetical protein